MYPNVLQIITRDVSGQKNLSRLGNLLLILLGMLSTGVSWPLRPSIFNM